MCICVITHSFIKCVHSVSSSLPISLSQSMAWRPIHQDIVVHFVEVNCFMSTDYSLIAIWIRSCRWSHSSKHSSITTVEVRNESTELISQCEKTMLFYQHCPPYIYTISPLVTEHTDPFGRSQSRVPSGYSSQQQ